MSFLADMIQVVGLEWPYNNLSPFTESVIGATICGRVLEHKQKSPTRPCQEFCSRHRSLNALLAQRIRMLRIYASLEYPDPIIAFVGLAAHIGVLMLYNLIESRPLGTDARGMQLTQALYAEHKQQALDAVADIAHLIAVLGQHFQVTSSPPFYRHRDPSYRKSRIANNLADAPFNAHPAPPRRPVLPIPPRA